MAPGVETLLLEALSVFVISTAAGIFVAQAWKFPSTDSLLLGGLGMSVPGVISGMLAAGI
jgi:hypothetical protein